MTSAVCGYIFSLDSEISLTESLKIWLLPLAKRWCFIFSLIDGTCSYRGFLSLKKRTSMNLLVETIPDTLKYIDLIQSPAVKKDCQFLPKEGEIRYDHKNIDGYSMNIVLAPKIPWIESIKPMMVDYESRVIRIITCNKNNYDKKEFMCDMGFKKVITEIPSFDNAKDLYLHVQTSYKSRCYFVELDTKMELTRLLEVCYALDNIKFGTYKSGNKSFYIKRPSLFVFVETYGELLENLDKTIWQFWSINTKNELVRY